ncbi:MAG: hypothetical protein V7642_620 [Burkholderiales bacterium]|jgi:hypothetical protein
MLTTTLGFSSPANPLQAYAKNVGVAARDFIAALLAIKPADEAEQATAAAHTTQGVPAASDDMSLFRLYCLASRASSFDVVSPELAKELRLIAARN